MSQQQSFVGRLSAIVVFAIEQRHSTLARGALMSVVLTGLGTGIGYVIQIFISRTLGAQEFGLYSYVLGLLNIARTIVTVSFDMAAIRFISIYHVGSDWGRFRGFLWTSRSVVGLLSLFGAFSCYMVTLAIRDRVTASLFQPLVAGCILLAPVSLLTLEMSLLQALRRVYESRIPNLFLRPLLIAAGVFVATSRLNWAPTAVVALYANVTGVVAGWLVSIWLMQRLVPVTARSAPAVRQWRDWSVFCAVNLGQNLIYLILSQQADIVIVGSLVGTKDAGLYAAASQISTLILLGVSSVNQYAAPVLAGFHDRLTDRGLQHLLGRTILLNAALSLPLIAVVVVFGPFLLNMFGPAFSAAYPVILILAVGNLINALWGTLWGDLLTMVGFQKESAAIVVLVTALNLALTFVLTPRLGIIGAAISTTLSVLIRSILVAAAVRIRLGFQPWQALRYSVAHSYSSPHT